MKVLVACEESQRVCIAFRKMNHEAYSCDIIECSGNHPEYHIKDDAIKLINGHCSFKTMDGKYHKIDGNWDLLIAHPPCTYLSNVATRQYSLKCCTPDKVIKRWEERAKAAIFFMQFVSSNAKRICIENPVGFMNTAYRKPDQIIHPYYFSDHIGDESYYLKRTCLWLKNLKPLERTIFLPKPEPLYICKGEKTKGKRIGWTEGMRNIKGGQPERAKARSKTAIGISNAMARQWGCEC